MNRKTKVMAICLVVVFGGLLAFNLIRNYKIKEFTESFTAPAVAVSTIVAKTSDWQPIEKVIGNIKAIQGVNVTSQQSGQIVKIRFKSGDFVEEGTVLVELNTDTDRATLAEDEATLALDKVNYQRQIALYKKAATSKQDVDTNLSDLRSSQAKTKKTMITIEQKSIKAPFTGLIGIRSVDKGEYVTTGETTIAPLQMLDPLYINFYVPEQLLPNLHLGEAIYFTVDAYPQYYFRANIRALDSKVDTDSHNILIQAEFPNCNMEAVTKHDKSQLGLEEIPSLGITAIHCDTEANKAAKITRFAFLPGMYATISLKMPPVKDAMVIPSTAITYSLHGDSVYLVKKKKDPVSGKTEYFVNQKTITTGSKQGNLAMVTKGIQPGDVIVNAGQLKLQNGTRVKINNSVKLNETPDLNTLGE